MVWSVCLLGENGDGEARRVDLLQLGSLAAPSDIDGLGINLATSKQLLFELQQAVVTIQEAALWAVSRSRTAGSTTTVLKDYRLRKFQSLFGTICLRIPRLIVDGRIESVLPCLRYCRSTGEFDEVQAKLSAWMSYRSAMELMGEMYPVQRGISAQTAMRQIKISADRMREMSPGITSTNTAPVALPLDTTFVRGQDKDATNGLEILVGAVSQGSESKHYFASPFKRKEDCIRLGKASLARYQTMEIEAFSDSARSVRAMAKSIGAPEKPISDWFHLSMRIQHVISVADALEASTKSIVLANNAVQRDLRQMRTELWKGDIRAVSRAIRAVQPNLRSFRDEPHAPTRMKRVKKLKAVMKKLDKYVRNPDARIVDYCARKTEGKSLGTSLVEGAAEFIVNARMAKSQHMRWTIDGAYNLLQVRTADINRRLAETKIAA